MHEEYTYALAELSHENLPADEFYANLIEKVK